MVNRSISLVKIRNRFKQVIESTPSSESSLVFTHISCLPLTLMHLDSLFSFILHQIAGERPHTGTHTQISQIFNKSHYTVRAIRYQSGRRSALAPFQSRNPPVSPPIGATLSSRTIWRIVWVVGSLLLGGTVASGTVGFSHVFTTQYNMISRKFCLPSGELT